MISKLDRFEWSLVVVYVAAQDATKHEFPAEMVCMCESDPLHCCVVEILVSFEDKMRKIKIIFM